MLNDVHKTHSSATTSAMDHVSTCVQLKKNLKTLVNVHAQILLASFAWGIKIL